MWEFSAPKIRIYCLKFLSLNFLPSCSHDACGFCFLFVFVSCFTYLALDLLGFLLFPLPPFAFPRFSHRIIWCACRNAYCSCCSLSYILNIICVQIEYKQSKRKGENKSVDITHNTQPGVTGYRLTTALSPFLIERMFVFEYSTNLVGS